MKDSLRKLATLSNCIPPRNTTHNPGEYVLKTYSSEINLSDSNYWLISENYCTTKANLMYQDMPRFHTETWHIFISERSVRTKNSDAWNYVRMHPSTFALFFPVNVELRAHVGIPVFSLTTSYYKDANYHKQDLWVRFPSPRLDNETSYESQRHEDELASWRRLNKVEAQNSYFGVLFPDVNFKQNKCAGKKLRLIKSF